MFSKLLDNISPNVVLPDADIPEIQITEPKSFSLRFKKNTNRLLIIFKDVFSL